MGGFFDFFLQVCLFRWIAYFFEMNHITFIFPEWIFNVGFTYCMAPVYIGDGEDNFPYVI